MLHYRQGLWSSLLETAQNEPEWGKLEPEPMALGLVIERPFWIWCADRKEYTRHRLLTNVFVFQGGATR